MTDADTAPHPDPHKMRVSQLHTCGCSRCQDTLKMHAVLDRLITDSDARLAELERLSQRIDTLAALVKDKS